MYGDRPKNVKTCIIMANMLMLCRSQWPRGLRYGLTAARLLVMRVGIAG